MVAPAIAGIDLFKIAGRSIAGWIPSFKTGAASHVRQPFCSQLEERLLLWLEYHPQVACYARGDIGPQFATTYRLPTPKHAPFAIGYAFEGKAHDYRPDVVGTWPNGKPFIADAGMEDDKRGDRNLAKAEAARRLARLQRGVFWIGTERTLTKRRHYNLVYLHARRKTFPAFADIATAVAEVWPWGEMVTVSEVASRLEHTFPANLVEAAIWKVVGDSAVQGHLLVDLEQFTLSRTLPLALLPPDASPLVPDPLPDTLLPEPDTQPLATISSESPQLVPGPSFDASALPSPQRELFHRNLRAVEQVLAGAQQTQVAKDAGIPRSTLSRLVKRTKLLGTVACVPYGSYTRKTTMPPAFQECIRRLYLLPTRLSMTAIREHTEMQLVAMRLSEKQGKPVKLPSYAQVRKEVHRLKSEPELVAVREGAKSVPRERQSAESFVLSIPSPTLLTQVDEHTMDLYVVTPSGVLTPMYNCARIKLTAPRDGCKLRSMSVIIPAGGSHDQEQDSEYHTRISSAREVHSRHRHHVRAGQEYGAQISASSGTVGDAPSAAQPSLQTGSVQRANPEVGSRGSLLQLRGDVAPLVGKGG